MTELWLDRNKYACQNIIFYIQGKAFLVYILLENRFSQRKFGSNISQNHIYLLACKLNCVTDSGELLQTDHILKHAPDCTECTRLVMLSVSHQLIALHNDVKQFYAYLNQSLVNIFA